MPDPAEHSTDETDGSPSLAAGLEPDRELPPAADGWRSRVMAVADALGIELSPLRVVLGAIVVVVLAVAGVVLLRSPDVPRTEDSLPFASTVAGGDQAATAGSVLSTSTTAAAEVAVHAAGAVASPGLYWLPAGSRVADALAAAGGPVADADVDRLNLAAPLTDGQRVYVPRVGEDDPGEAGGSSPRSVLDGGEGTGSTVPSPVDLNTANAAQLEALPGIGPVTAEAILEYRERTGGFRSVDELLEVRGIGDATLAELRDLVTV